MDTPLLDTIAAAEYLGLAPNTLEVWRSAGRYDLPFVKVGRRVKYSKAALDAWIAARTRTGPAPIKPRLAPSKR